MKRTLLFFVSIFCLFSAFAQAKTMNFKSLTTSMGLSHGDITCFCQDFEGNMWIGTVEGLNKFDGIGFTVFKKVKNDTASLSTSYINCIYEDKQNNLWIGLSDGLCRYNRDKNNFERIPFIDIHNNKFENSIYQIFEDNFNQLWIGCHLGVYLFDRESRRFNACFEDSYSSNILTDCSGICQDKNGMLWFSFQHSNTLGLIKYDNATKNITRFSAQNPTYTLKENSISTIMVDDKNNLWIGYFSSGIEVLDEQSKIINRYGNFKNSNSVSSNYISYLIQNKEGEILIGTNGSGLNVFDPNSKSFFQYSASKSTHSLLSNTIQKIHISRDGIVWIGCWGGGVNIHDKRFDRFVHYKQDIQDKNSLNGNSVTCFTEDLNGNIWISTDGGGINLFKPETGNFTSFKSDSKNPQSLTNDKVLALETDHKGGLWAGMWQGGLNNFKIDGEKLILKKKYNFLDKNDVTSNCIFNIYFSKKKELWIGSFAFGAFKFDPSTEKFTSIKLSDVQSGYNSVKDIYYDSYDCIWFASDVLGLVRLNQKNGETDRFIHNDKDSTSLINLSINVIFEDSKKRLWIGGDECGLNLFNRNTKSFTHYTTEQGLPDNSILGILEDDHSNLWISTRNGLSKASFDSINEKLKLTFRNYSIQDGLQDKVFNRWAYLKSSSGEMYFGGLNGFNVFHPDSVKDNSFIPPVHITDFLLFNKPVVVGAKGSPLNKHISQTKKIELNYDQSSFTFRFIALNYVFSEKNQYAYFLEGFDKEWFYSGSKREATYTNINPGKYIFRVKGSNNDGIWNETGTAIEITITPPWWNTKLAIAGFALVVIFSFLGFYFVRTNQLRKQKEKLEMLVHKRTLEIEEKNITLNSQSQELNNSNILLQDRQRQIEKQVEMLLNQSEKLSRTNSLLEERQQFIEEQSEELMVQSEELLHANRNLNSLNATKDRFFSILAHDLRNPFNNILGFTEILNDKDISIPDEEIKEITKQLYQSASSTYNLLENLLEWSRSQSNKIAFEPKQENLANICKEVIENFISNSKNIKINYLPDEEIEITIDVNMFKTILRNLITNAIKFSFKNSEINIYTVRDSKNVIITVSDNGLGIEKEHWDKIFDFTQKYSTNGTAHETGTGLGLIICKEFVEKHGGQIWVESIFGKGSDFKLTIPFTT